MGGGCVGTRNNSGDRTELAYLSQFRCCRTHKRIPVIRLRNDTIKTMKTGYAFLVVLMIVSSASAQKIAGHTKSPYTLVLEVQSYTAVSDGSYITTGILTTSQGKFRCTLSAQKHYLIAGSHRARKIGQDRLRVIVPIKKHKNERWTFKIISEEEVGN